ncbi:MAG: DUF1156 domain-containing protein [Rhodopirellula sp.]|nr:DUF1156 domain-containing protein [Rhodopirellula sp.]
MITPRQKLIEVALPLKAINDASAREKSIRHGHPSTLHLWWARRPLAACRAVLFASLVDDPDSDPMFAGDEDLAASKRAELFNLIEELVQWENSNNSRVINRARAEIARCVATQKIEEGVFKKDDVLSLPSPAYQREAGGECSGKAEKLKVAAFEIRQLLAKPEHVNAFLAEYAPPLHDPFAGGGAIPLEAQRLGLKAYASDLNPVAVMINKAMIEIPPKFAGLPPVNPEWQRKSASQKAATVWQGPQGLAEDVRYYGQWIRDEAEKRIGHRYPKIKVTAAMTTGRPDLKPYLGKELTVIAWLWARTVESSNPAYRGCHVPLVSSFWLSSGARKEAYIEPVIEGKTYRFEVRTGKPRDKAATDAGTKLSRGAHFRCIVSQSPLSPEYVRAEGMAGRLGARLMAIVAKGDRGRVYLPPTEEHEDSARQARATWKPEQEFFQQALGFRIGGYGMVTWADLFTARQLESLATLSELVVEVREVISKDASAAAVLPDDDRPLRDGGSGPVACAEAVSVYLAFALNKQADLGNNLCRWEPVAQCPRQLFGRQAIPMVWDFAEGNPLGDSSGAWTVFVDGIVKAFSKAFQNVSHCAVGIAQQADAATQTTSRNKIVSTDPPYYDNIGYADLSDFFYVWMRRTLQGVYPSLFSTVLVPKVEELVATPDRHGSKDAAEIFFMSGMTRALQAIAEQAHGRFPVTVYYAFKQAEGGEDGISSTGWETFLDAALRAGFSLSGTWPMRTENDSRLRGQVSNALASSIVLVCRQRPTDAPMTTRKDFLAALRRELPPALRHLQQGNIAPVDLAQASIGPGMAVFSRYSRIMETDGKPMTVRTALQLINQTLDETLAEQEGDFDADTAWAVAWFEQFAFNDGPFGDAETLSKAKNTAISALATAGIVKTAAGKARLLRVDELPTNWDPTTDQRLTVWEMVHHLIQVMNADGEMAAATLVNKLGGAADAARELAYRLYTICERRKRADEALAYNGLVIAWPELTKLALAERSKATEKQSKMF